METERHTIHHLATDQRVFHRDTSLIKPTLARVLEAIILHHKLQAVEDALEKKARTVRFHSETARHHFGFRTCLGLLAWYAVNRQGYALPFAGKFDALTPREHAVMQAMANDNPRKKIGTILGIEHRSVIFHINNARAKTELPHLSAAVTAYAVHTRPPAVPIEAFADN